MDCSHYFISRHEFPCAVFLYNLFAALCDTALFLLHILVIRSDIFFLYSQMFSPDFLFLNKPAILTLLAVPLPVGDSQCTPVHGALHNSKHQQSRVQVAGVQAVHSW